MTRLEKPAAPVWPADVESLHGAGPLENMYRMPRIFGPSAGPRNMPASVQAIRYVHRRTQITIDALTEADAIGAYLPPRCRLDGEPVIRVSVSCLKDLGWLAGRGYNIITVQFLNIRFEGETDNVFGSLDAVLWESLCDPIITGREEIAVPKIFADIPDPVLADGVWSASASWQGFRFFELTMTDLVEASTPGEPIQSRMSYKYTPRCGPPGFADAEYMTQQQADPNAPPTTLHARQTGKGAFAFHPARWEDMPTQYHVVNALSAMPIHKVIATDLKVTSQGKTDTIGGGSGSGQRIIS